MSKIPYDLKKIRGIVFDVDGVLSPIVVPLGDDGVPRRMANVRDGYAMKLAAREGIKLCIISGGYGEALEKRFNIIGVKDVYLKAGNKLDVLKEWMEREGLEPEEVAFAGDDVPDRSCMLAVGLGVAPADACSDIHAIAGYISPCQGGHGVARDLIEEVLKAQGKWPLEAKAFG